MQPAKAKQKSAPFSGKQKKAQLAEKRERRAAQRSKDADDQSSRGQRRPPSDRSGGGDIPGELGCVRCCGDGGFVLFVVDVATVCDLAAPDESEGRISCIGFTSSVSSDAAHLAFSSPPLEQLSPPFSSSSFSGVNTAPLLAPSVAEFAAPS